METNKFEIHYKLNVQNDKNTIYSRGANNQKVDDIEGLALWYINHAPVERDLRTAFGYKAEFNGIGVYLFKHENKWRLMSIYN